MASGWVSGSKAVEPTYDPWGTVISGSDEPIWTWGGGQAPVLVGSGRSGDYYKMADGSFNFVPWSTHITPYSVGQDVVRNDVLGSAEAIKQDAASNNGLFGMGDFGDILLAGGLAATGLGFAGMGPLAGAFGGGAALGGETALGGLAADGGMFGLPTAASAGGVSAGGVGTGALGAANGTWDVLPSAVDSGITQIPGAQFGVPPSLTQPSAPVTDLSAPFNTTPAYTQIPGAVSGTLAAGAAGIAGGAGALRRVMSGAGTAADYLALGLPLAGAALGAVGADSKPAGTTTTVQDLPGWLKPYVTGNLDAAKAYMTANPQDNSMIAPARAQLNSTIAGDYLNSNPANPFYTGAMDYTNNSMDYLRPTAEGKYLNANPYIDAMYAKARDAVGAGIDSRFSKAGRYGSGAMASTLGTTFGNLATDIYGNNYANERTAMNNAGTTLIGADSAQQASRLAAASGLGANYNTARGQQLTAATGAPGFTADAATSPFAAFGAYGNLLKQNVSSTTSPYFTNPVGGALFGALAGYGLSKAFG